VRAWINQWDLRRLDPTHQPEIEVDHVKTDYSEDPELETATEGSAETQEEIL